jgi:hypothetical protein
MKQNEEALRLKEDKARNENIIRRQREAELMKNNNVKQMIRQQKLMAEERKEMVSNHKDKVVWVLNENDYPLTIYQSFLGTAREKASTAK